MSERTVTAKLTADVGQYKAAMKDAEGASKKFEQGTNRSLQAVSVKMGAVGKSMTTKLTLPLLAVGAGAVKMSMDFDASMSKITALVGLSADEVAGMRDSVMDLSGSTARAPKELSDALFVLTSAGLRGDDAMSALEASAKASAAGLGETNDIARAVAGAMNAYGPEVLDAGRATDILTAAARAGNFETSQLAGSLGRVLPFANAAGASFEDVGGAVALLTRTNGDAAQSITSVTALMRGFVTPTAEATKILGELGITSEDLRGRLGRDGLAATLSYLSDELGVSQEQFSLLFGGSEAAGAAIQILDADAQTLADTFGVTAEAAGMTDEAFATMAETGAFKMQQAWADLQVALVEVGGIIGPVVADVAGVVGDLAQAFGDLPEGAQTAIVVLGGVVAAAGPALVITSKLITAFIALKSAMAGAAGVRIAGQLSAMAGMAGPLGALAVALGAVTYGFINMGAAQRENIAELRSKTAANLDAAAAAADEAAAAFVTLKQAMDLGDPVDVASQAFRDLALDAPELAEAMAAAGVTFEDLGAYAVESGGNLGDFDNRIIDAGRSIDGFDTNAMQQQLRDTGWELYDAASAAEAVGVAAGELPDPLDESAESLEGQADAAGDVSDQFADAVAAIAEFNEAVLDSISATFDYERATMALEQASSDYYDQMMETAVVVADSTKSDQDKAQAQRDLREAQLDVIEQALATADAYSVETGASEGSAKQVQNQIDALIDLAAQHPELQGEIDDTIDKMLEVPGTVDSRIDVDTADANADIDGTRDNLNRLNGQVARTLVINTVRSVQEYRTLGSPNRSGTNAVGMSSGGPVKAGRLYEVGESNVAEMFMAGGRQYMIPGNDGNIVPGSKLKSSPDDAGRGDLVIHGDIYTESPTELRRELRQLLNEKAMMA